MAKTRSRSRSSSNKKLSWKGWSKQKPSTAQRSVMLKNCGKKCFLGPNKSFPICIKNTCKRSRKGVSAAYIRAKEMVTIKGTKKYKKILNKASRMLKIKN
jgi:hypothetical protein